MIHRPQRYERRQPEHLKRVPFAEPLPGPSTTDLAAVVVLFILLGVIAL